MERDDRTINNGFKSSAEETIDRFATKKAADKYLTALDGTRTHERETRCIRRALKLIPAGSRILDLPCGTGRLIPFLRDMGYRVTAADSSAHMTQFALDRMAHLQHKGQCDYLVTSIFDTGFKGKAFDAVICNRLFHHFREASVRQQALRELRRICGGTIIVSFFCNFSIDALVFHMKNAIKRRRPSDRIPVNYSVFSRDVKKEGLKVESIIATRPGISKQWYLVLKP